jgi:hypothetical protein
MPMLDFEVFSGTVGATSYAGWANAWCSNVVSYAAANGVLIKPVIYVSACNAGNFTTSVAQWYNDIADWNSESAQTGTPWSVCSGDDVWGSSSWNFWQYNDTASLPGFTGEQPDVDVYNGTAASLFSSLVAISAGPAISQQPTNIGVVAGANAAFSVTATGTGTLHYQWEFNGTNISGATAAAYTVTNAQLANAGDYTVLVTDSVSNILSSGASLGIYSPLTNAPASVVAPPGLVDWWTGDGNLTDLYGTAHGTPRGVITYAPGEIGLAIQLDGSTSVVTTGAADLAVPWTVTLWVDYAYTPQNSAGILEDGTYSLKLEQYNGTHEVGLSIYGLGDYIFNPPYIVPTLVWCHLAFVGTSSNTSFYANGVLTGTLTNSIPLPRNYMGGGYYTNTGQYGDFLNGRLDEIMVFNKALTAAQISSIYAAGTDGVVKAPQITGASATNRQISFSMLGLTGKNYTVYASTNLANWTIVTSLTNTYGTNFFTEAITNSLPEKFYKISESY